MACAALAASCLWTAGCRTPGSATSATSKDAGDIHRLVKTRVDEQNRHADGAQRWASLTGGVYQTEGDLAESRARLRYEQARRGAAQRLIQTGATGLETCLAFSLEFNDTIQAKRAALRAVGGERIINRSRFLPALTYSLEHDAPHPDLGGATNETHQSVRLSQTVLEFGEDHDDDVALRDAEREALFDYEDAIRDALSGVRQKFFTIVLRQRQLQERKAFLQEFRNRYEEISQLEKARRALEVDVLTARLNMLNEEARINSVQKEIFRNKVDLLYGMGVPVGMTDLELNGQVEGFGLALDAAVNIALQRSPDIAEARADVAEQARVLGELAWDYMPSIDLQAGWQNDQNAFGVDLGTTDRLYSLAAYAEAHADPFGGYRYNDSDLLDEDEEGWFVDLSLEIPIFQGLERKGKYKQERALLDQARHVLRDKTDAVEGSVRKLYQTMLERRQAVEILRETVTISRKRLRVQERLKELGKITDNQLETFRTQYFTDQDSFFSQQIQLMTAQENVRHAMRYFEPLPAKGE